MCHEGEISGSGSKLDGGNAAEDEASGPGKARNIFKEKERTGLEMGEKVKENIDIRANTRTYASYVYHCL